MLTLDILQEYATDNQINAYDKKDAVGQLYLMIREIIKSWKIAKTKGLLLRAPKEVEEQHYRLATQLNKVHKFRRKFETGTDKDSLKFETPFFDCKVKKYDKNYMQTLCFWTMEYLSNYYNKRMGDLFGNRDQMFIKTKKQTKEGVLESKVPVFRLDDKFGDIEILITNLEGEVYTYQKEVKEGQFETREYYLTRKWHYNDGAKYLMPKGEGTLPYFTEYTKEAYRNQKEIETLVLTEGAFKAESGGQNGIHVVGLSSIFHYKDRASTTKDKFIHKEIETLIKVCKVKKVVILHDGDCRDISLKDLSLENDLKNRPHGFYKAAETTKDLINKIGVESLGVQYATIKTNDIKEKPKGLDDLMAVLLPKEKEAIAGIFDGLTKNNKYLRFFKIDKAMTKLRDWFKLNDKDAFYSLHSEIIGSKEFVFNKDRFVYSPAIDSLKLLVPHFLENLLWIGDDFYKIIQKNVFLGGKSVAQKELMGFSKSTLAALYGSKFYEYLKESYYLGFENVPDHKNYQRTIKHTSGNFYNKYSPLPHEPKVGSCDTILNFLNHIFGGQIQMGLDYIQLLYQQPTQKLPVMILYSPENGTGKSKFQELLYNIFLDNAVVINNDDLKSEFGTARYAHKLLVMCEETLLDRKSDAERIKAQSTAEAPILANPKGMKAYSIQMHSKFIFNSNNLRMIYASEFDERYWIIRVPVVSGKKDPDLMDKMRKEIPAFLHMLDNRAIFNPKKDRMWFDPRLIKTETLKQVIQVNEHSDVRELREKIEDYFISFPNEDELKLSTKDIEAEFLKGRKESWIKELLKDRLQVRKATDQNGKTKVVRSYIMRMLQTNSNDFEPKKFQLGGKRVWVFERSKFVTEEVEYETEEQEGELTQDFIDQANKTVGFDDILKQAK